MTIRQMVDNTRATVLMPGNCSCFLDRFESNCHLVTNGDLNMKDKVRKFIDEFIWNEKRQNWCRQTVRSQFHQTHHFIHIELMYLLFSALKWPQCSGGSLLLDYMLSPRFKIVDCVFWNIIWVHFKLKWRCLAAVVDLLWRWFIVMTCFRVWSSISKLNICCSILYRCWIIQLHRLIVLAPSLVKIKSKTMQSAVYSPQIKEGIHISCFSLRNRKRAKTYNESLR